MNIPWRRGQKSMNISERAAALAALPEGSLVQRLAPVETLQLSAERPQETTPVHSQAVSTQVQQAAAAHSQAPQNQAAPAPAAPPAPSLANAPLDVIGLRNETLRRQIEDVEDGFDEIEKVRLSFRELIAPMAELLSELESTKAKLHENKIRFGLLQESHEGLKSRHNSLSSEADLAFNARDSLLQENRELLQKIQQLELALSEANLDVRERANANEKLERLLEIETRNSGALEAETKRLKQAMESRDDYMARVEAQLKSASDANELLEQELGSLRLSSSEIAASFNSRNRRLAEYETAIEQNRGRIYELENALANEQSAHSALQARHLEEGERLRGESSQLVHKTDALRGRADMAEKLLSEARAQLRSKVEELRATERQSLEARILAETYEKKLRASSEDLSKAEQRIAAMDEMRVNLVDRVNSLTKALHSRDGAATSAEQKTENLARRHDEALRTAQREREQAERMVSELRDQLERERAERILAEGALQAARQGRPRRGHAPAAEAYEAYEQQQPQPQLERRADIQASDEFDEAAPHERRIAS